jgi:hypothetical protein
VHERHGFFQVGQVGSDGNPRESILTYITDEARGLYPLLSKEPLVDGVRRLSSQVRAEAPAMVAGLATHRRFKTLDFQDGESVRGGRFAMRT